jgi:BirA family biotin operon repressor/biotin-[acetyl-CoA-carboxylase] ligase
VTSPVADAAWLVLESAGSTQDVATQHLAAGDLYGAVLALDQVSGRGRFDRKWVSSPGDSLAVSFVFRAYADHPQPHLIGMAAAIAAAGALNCQLQWPNDLVVEGRKLGGILTELSTDSRGRKIPIVGVGINLNQTVFPEEIADRATSLKLIDGGVYDAREIAERIVKRIQLLPEPNDWADIQLAWDLFDVTPGKRYRLQSGEEAVAIGVGMGGQLICSVEGDPRTVYAADALLGSSHS